MKPGPVGQFLLREAENRALGAEVLCENLPGWETFQRLNVEVVDDDTSTDLK